MKIRSNNKVTAEFNMSSMTDIIFLLLIFFIVLLTTMSQTNALDLVLPSSDGKTDQVETVAVSINENLDFYIDKDKVDVENIEDMLNQILADKESKNIVLHVAKGVPIEEAVTIMDIAYRNDYNVVLAVEPKD